MSELLDRFLADRDGLDAAGIDALARQLRADPAAAAEAAALLRLDELLSRRFASDRGHFVARATTRLATADSSSFVRRVRAPLRRRRRRPSRPWPVAAAAVAVMLLIAGAMILRAEPAQGPTLVASDGRVVGGGAALAPGAVVRPGDALVVDRTGGATLAWPDGTRIGLGAGATLRIETVAPKRLRLERGTLDAEVTAQSADAPLVVATPHATATVLGTRLRLVVGRATRIDVFSGTVRFATAAGAVDVRAEEIADAGPAAPPRLRPRRMTLAFGGGGPLPAGILADRGEVFDPARGHGWQRPDDGSTYPGVVWNHAPRPTRRIPIGPWRGPDPLRSSGLAVGWAGHAEDWRMAVPDGLYDLEVCVGGTGFAQGPHRVAAQGRVLIEDVVTAAGGFHRATARVEVTDGWLHLRVGGAIAPPTADGSSDTILCFLRLSVAEPGS